MANMLNKMRGIFGTRGEKPAHDVPDVKNQAVISQSLADVFSFATTAPSGYVVNERTAMCVSAVYACVGLISGAVSCMPLPIFRQTTTGREATDHDLWWLLNREPSPACTAATFWEYLTTSLLLQGDAFARIVRQSSMSPKIIGFEPWHPSNVEVRRENGRMKYLFNDPLSDQRFVLDQDDVLHIPGLGFNGLRGRTPLQHALRNSAGIALAADDHTSHFFANGARPDFVLTAPDAAEMTMEQKEEIRELWSQIHGGASNSHKPALLTGGLNLKELTMKAEDAQLIATRQFQIEDIARIFGVPPFMIGMTEKTTSFGSGVENMSIGFVKYTIMRHLRKFEQEINRKALRDKDIFAEFTTAGIERGDLKSRYEAHRMSIGRAGEPGFMTVNEVRKLENLPPIDGGDILNKGDNNAPNAQASGG